jgi:hypothetical protein
MGNNGAISALTALPFTYPNCYLWLPTNAINAGSAAGWYYAQMSSATAGTVFNNTYTTGKPAIPASPTAFVTTGPGAFTGDTGEEFGPTITLPGNALGPNGRIRSFTLWSVNNNANAKTPRLRFSGNAGTAYQQPSLASVQSGLLETEICNAGVTGSQKGQDSARTGPGVSGSVLTTSAVDTTANSTLVISMQKATATDNIILESFIFELFYGA